MQERVRILFIDPSEPWVTNNSNLRCFEQVMIPIGMMCLSAFLKKRFGEEIHTKIISTIVDLQNIEQLGDVVDDFMPHIIGIRSVAFYDEQVNRLADICRNRLPDVLLLAGGPNVTLGNTGILGNTNIDIYIEGEGEETLYEITDRFIRCGRRDLLKDLHSIRGILYRKNSRIVRNASRELIKDLDQLPIPDYAAIDLDKYTGFLNYGYNRRKMAVLFTSRGCPYRCIYCHSVFGKAFRYRSAQSIYDEITYLYNTYGIKDFCIVDDNFTFNKERVDEFTEKIINSNLKVNLYFPNGIRADSLTFELVDKLIEAGMIWVTFSLETASERLQRFIKKNVDIDKLEKIVAYCCERNVITNLCVMVGFPTETLEEAERSLEYLSSFRKLTLPYYFSVKYYPGTEIYHIASEHGVTIDKDIYQHPYHGNLFQETPQISCKDFERLNYKYLRDVFMNLERLRNSIEILGRHFSQEEIKDIYTLFFRRRIKNIEEDVLKVLAR